VALKRRLFVAGLAVCLAAALLVTAKKYSVSLIAFVVEEALIQKLPAGSDPTAVRLEFRNMLAGLPDRQLRLERLLYMSQYLEKLQDLDRPELERLLTIKAAGIPAAPP